MSGTRSPFPKAPATEALIVAHGQPGDPAPAGAQTVALAARVQALIPEVRVRGATLAMPGALEAAVATAKQPPLIYPLFMSDGWFTKTELPRRLGGVEHHMLPPLGVDPELTALAADAITDCAASRGWPVESVTLVLAAHGSGRSDTSARAVRDFAARLRQRLPLGDVRIGYVEQAPSIVEVATRAGPRAVCLPFFAARGGHVQDDIPDALRQAAFAGALLPPIGLCNGIAKIVAQQIRMAAEVLPGD